MWGPRANALFRGPHGRRRRVKMTGQMHRILLLAACLCVLTVARIVTEAAAPHAASPAQQPTRAAAQSARPVPQSASAAPQTPAAPAAVADTRAALNRYCVTCHNARVQSGGLALDTVDPAAPANAPEVWEKVVRRLQTQAMPPQGMPRPDQATYHTLIETLVSRLDSAAAARPAPGRPMLRRMNRAEYANAIRDLLALDVDAAALLPARRLGLRLRQHRRRARRVAVAAGAVSVGGRHASARSRWATWNAAPGGETYRVRQDLSQNQHIEGLPLGTIGGARRAAHLSARRRVRLPGHAVAHQLRQHARPRAIRTRSRSRSTARACTWRRLAATTTCRTMFEHAHRASDGDSRRG